MNNPIINKYFTGWINKFYKEGTPLIFYLFDYPPKTFGYENKEDFIVAVEHFFKTNYTDYNIVLKHSNKPKKVSAAA